jgi:hypothetical protein
MADQRKQDEPGSREEEARSTPELGEPQAEFGLDERTRVRVYEPSERSAPTEEEKEMAERAVEVAREAVDKAAEKLSSGYRIKKGGRIFEARDQCFFMEYENGQELDLRDLVE